MHKLLTIHLVVLQTVEARKPCNLIVESFSLTRHIIHALINFMVTKSFNFDVIRTINELIDLFGLGVSKQDAWANGVVGLALFSICLRKLFVYNKYISIGCGSRMIEELKKNRLTMYWCTKTPKFEHLTYAREKVKPEADWTVELRVGQTTQQQFAEFRE